MAFSWKYFSQQLFTVVLLKQTRGCFSNTWKKNQIIWENDTNAIEEVKEDKEENEGEENDDENNLEDNNDINEINEIKMIEFDKTIVLFIE